MLILYVYLVDMMMIVEMMMVGNDDDDDDDDDIYSNFTTWLMDFDQLYAIYS